MLRCFPSLVRRACADCFNRLFTMMLITQVKRQKRRGIQNQIFAYKTRLDRLKVVSRWLFSSRNGLAKRPAVVTEKKDLYESKCRSSFLESKTPHKLKQFRLNLKFYLKFNLATEIRDK